MNKTYVGDDGHYIRSKSVGVLQFDANGRYTTGNAQLDSQLTSLAKSHCRSDASRLENLNSLHQYICDAFGYRANTYIEDGRTGWEVEKALEMLKNRKGNCYNYAALSTMLARKLGYQARALSGYFKAPIQSYWAVHGWCEITENGVLYTCDTSLEAHFSPNNNLGWKLCMKPYTQLPYKLRVEGVVLN